MNDYPIESIDRIQCECQMLISLFANTSTNVNFYDIDAVDGIMDILSGEQFWLHYRNLMAGLEIRGRILKAAKQI